MSQPVRLPLSTEERIELVFLSGREGWSSRRVAEHFNQLHPEREHPVSSRTVQRLVNKFRETGSVHDLPRSGRPPSTVVINGKQMDDADLMMMILNGEKIPKSKN